MQDFQYLRNPKPSPRVLAVYTGILGLFGTGSFIWALIMGFPVPRLAALYSLPLPLLLVAAAVHLWHARPRGWWLAWCAMVVMALYGFFMDPIAAQEPIGQFEPIFAPGFMLVAAGLFFGMLAHRDVCDRCFDSGSLPHPVFGATPALFLIIGAGSLFYFGGLGRYAGPTALAFSLLMMPWVLGPLWALLRGREQWHATP